MVSAAVMLAGALSSHAQITLYDAQDVGQTKATLSADFPDLGQTHGFQYKYGTLPVIDDFSKLALSPQSDPVKLSTTGSYAWSARTVKGWVESKGQIPGGQSSTMSATVTLTAPTEISFEWAVDSEEGVGLLRFIVDGETVKEISGLLDFDKVSHEVAAGKHTISWTYYKKSATNQGLDIGMVKNILIRNTTPGSWITTTAASGSTQLECLYPSQNYLYRAFSENGADSIFSAPNRFRTTDIVLTNGAVSNITQTKATYTTPALTVDNDPFSSQTVLFPYDTFIEKLVDSIYKTFLTSYQTNGFEVGFYRIQATVTSSSSPWLTIKFTTDRDGELSFNYRDFSYSWKANNIYQYVGYTSVILDGVREDLKGTGGTYRKNIGPGTHTLTIRSVHNGSDFSPSIFSLAIDGSVPTSIEERNGITSVVIKYANLNPCTTYKVRTSFTPQYESPLEEKWPITDYTSQFTTLPLKASEPSVSATTQSTATIESSFEYGDATITAMGLQYRDATGKRWTSYPMEISEGAHSQKLTRLKPSTAYTCRAYIKCPGNDTVFSPETRFSTLSIQALAPSKVKVTQSQVTLQGEVKVGDANIYQRGIQYKATNATEWISVEDGGTDSVFTTVIKGLYWGKQYQARTFVQAAGCNMICSDAVDFTTLDSYFGSDSSVSTTQTSIILTQGIAELDDAVIVEEYGFEYYFGYIPGEPWPIENPQHIRIAVVPSDGKISTTISNLVPGTSISYNPYIKLKNGDLTYRYQYFKEVSTNQVFLTIKSSTITPTGASFEFVVNECVDEDKRPFMDADVTDIAYNITQRQNAPDSYIACSSPLTISGLEPETRYFLYFSGKVDGKFCRIQDPGFRYFVFTTPAVSINPSFTNITQTKAQMDVSIDAGDLQVTDLYYKISGRDYVPCGASNVIKNLKPNTFYYVEFKGKVNGEDKVWWMSASALFSFSTESVISTGSVLKVDQTSALVKWTESHGDATYKSSGMELSTNSTFINPEVILGQPNTELRVTNLTPDTKYYYRSFIETEEGGKQYETGSDLTFTTKVISCANDNVSNISNRSATMNGVIDCDAYSSAEFGFQWKKMTGWESDPAFTKGVKNDDGTIAVALVPGMLDPDTDYQYRSAVRYKGNVYTATDWVTFRTESEFVYYPASVYTMYRTDRENNAIILCGYFVAGSETVVSQGYEYWRTDTRTSASKTAAGRYVVNTDESMAYTFAQGELAEGQYALRAFVKTEAGNTIYGDIVGFTVTPTGALASDVVMSDDEPVIYAEDSMVKVRNAEGMDCRIYDIYGKLIHQALNMQDYEEFRLPASGVFIVRLSNGDTVKLRI